MTGRFIFIFLALLCIAPAAHAASLSGTDPVRYLVSPENPTPYSTVTIEAQGIGNFLGNSTITWSKDGKPFSSGVGNTVLSFTAGGIGETTDITVTIESGVYGTLTHDFLFNPSFVNMVWEAQTTVPPFYTGKALASPGSVITVYAFPVVRIGGVAQKNTDLSFRWKLNGQAQSTASGMGRSSFSFESNQLHTSEDVSVSIYTSSGVMVGQGSVTVPFTSPALVLYEHDPLRGVLYRNALGGSFTLSGTETTVRAVPYFFSVESGGQNTLHYEWRLNGAVVTGPSTAQGELTVRQAGSGSGSASLSVSLQNTGSRKLLQAAESFFTILFGQTPKTLLFGL